MRFRLAAAVILVLMVPVFATPAPAQASSASASTPSKIDPAKEADIRRLFEVTGAKKLVMGSIESAQKSIRPLMANLLPPGEYREKLIDLFFARFQAKADVKHLIEIAVPIYDKRFSGEEIKGLIKFYETPLGQKALSALPELTNEMREEGQKWGQQLGREAMIEVLAEHPDLKEQMEQAGRATRSK